MKLFKNLSLEHFLSPQRPWVLFMTWRDLFFASWRVPIEAVRAHIPPELELDTFDGSAWVTLVPMRVTDMHWRGIEPIPGMDSFRELNFRTYVRVNGRAGVFFLSIECPATFQDWIARKFFGVPYFHSQMASFNDGVSYHYATERVQADRTPAAFFGAFRPQPGGTAPAPGSLEQFLLERYSLYFVQNGVVHRGDIQHAEWNVQQAEAQIDVNTISSAEGFDLSNKPDHVGFVLQSDTLIFPPVREEISAAASE